MQIQRLSHDVACPRWLLIIEKPARTQLEFSQLGKSGERLKLK